MGFLYMEDSIMVSVNLQMPLQPMGWEKTGSLPPSLSSENPREEFGLAWPRSRACDNRYSQGDEVQDRLCLCHSHQGGHTDIALEELL